MRPFSCRRAEPRRDNIFLGSFPSTLIVLKLARRIEHPSGHVVIQAQRPFNSTAASLIVHDHSGLASTAQQLTMAFSCGARSASNLKEKDYLRSTLSRRQLQGFVRCRRSGTYALNQRRTTHIEDDCGIPSFEPQGRSSCCAAQVTATLLPLSRAASQASARTRVHLRG